MIRRRPVHQDMNTGKDRWLVSYSDFITLLFAFFVVMYSVSQVSEQKYRTLSETLAKAFEGRGEDSDMTQLADMNTGDSSGKISGLVPEVNLVEARELAREVNESLVNLVTQTDITINATEEWVEIEVDANLLFDSASAEPSEEAQDIFRELAEILAPFDNEIEVSGHTDNVPISTEKFASNWELSAARATAVVKILSANGIFPERMSAVGYGEFRPEADNDTEEGRAKNRRVVLMVAKTPVQRTSVTEIDWRSDLAANQVAQELTPAAPEEPERSEGREEIEPVRLEGGGLLFTSDPDLPRSSQ